MQKPLPSNDRCFQNHYLATAVSGAKIDGRKGMVLSADMK
jgi:hypothetical protein